MLDKQVQGPEFKTPILFKKKEKQFGKGLKSDCRLGIMVHTYNPRTQEVLRQEACQFKVNLGYVRVMTVQTV
jgi:hypothetical protein